MSSRPPRANPFERTTPTQRQHIMFGADALMKMEEEILLTLMDQHRLPQDWHEIWQERDRRDVTRVRVTARFDADVVKFFKAMGEGYQHRMNRVLRAYMHLRLGKIVDGPDTSDFVLRPEKVMRAARRKTQWGHNEALMALAGDVED